MGVPSRIFFFVWNSYLEKNPSLNYLKSGIWNLANRCVVYEGGRVGGPPLYPLLHDMKSVGFLPCPAPCLLDLPKPIQRPCLGLVD